MSEQSLRIFVGERAGEVSAVVVRPAASRRLLVLAHGAGAGMRHSFMEALALRLAERGTATLRYQFPYMEAARRRPDPPPVLHRTVKAAVSAGRETAGALPLFAGGKSMGGRMTSQAAAAGLLPPLEGLVFFGFPLHPAGCPSSVRADHLEDVDVPALFLQGTRDALADLDLLRPVCTALRPRARLHVVEGGDHSFQVLRRSGRTNDEVLDEVADVVASWPGSLASAGST